ncbi:MAG: hypothetical protein D3926_20055 [Desulfobacteraceae bacterium]|nr:MAG: hypothetical protein D3926_20055 [Desulfobacteraceae bacterium]
MSDRQRYDIWVHGVNTIVEYPDHAETIRHAGWGTLIEQREDPPNRYNWFHLPIPTPTIIQGEDNRLDWLALKVWMNENARLDRIHVRMGGSRIISVRPGIVGSDRDIEERIGRAGDDLDMVTEGLTVCAKVDFLSGSPRGRIIFRGAGAVFRPRIIWD